MKKHIKEYIFSIYGHGSFALADVSYILNLAIRDGVTDLYMGKSDYEQISNFMAYCGAWNWDKKTFMGINLIVED